MLFRNGTMSIGTVTNSGSPVNSLEEKAPQTAGPL